MRRPSSLAAAVVTCAGCGRFDFDARPPFLVQATACQISDGMTVSCPFNADVRAQNTVILGIDFAPGSASIASIVDSLGDSYSIVVGPYDNADYRAYVAWAPIVRDGADTVTVTLDTAAAIPELRLHEFAAVARVGAFDTSVTAMGMGTAPLQFESPPLVTSSPNELIFAVEPCDGHSAAGPGYIEAQNAFGDESEYTIAPTPGTYVATGMLTSGNRWMLNVATFRGSDTR